MSKFTDITNIFKGDCQVKTLKLAYLYMIPI